MDVDEVRRRAKAGPLALILRRAFAVLVGLITTIVVPRFVSPQAYGLAAMSTVIFQFADMFKDFGLTSALMRKGEISPGEINFLFWFNVFTTGVLTAVLAAVSPLAGGFFHAPIVTAIILVSLIGFLFGGITMQHRAILDRDLQFAKVATIDSISLFVQFVATVALALAGLNVWALVLGSLSGSITGGVLFIFASKWRPSRPALVEEVREILRFGFNTSVYSISVFISNSLMAVLCGRLLGAAPLGQYNRSFTILFLPARNAVEPIAGAAMPVMARLRSHEALYRQAYLELIVRLSMMVLPAAVIMVIGGRALVIGLLGRRWEMAGDILSALGPVAGTWGLGYPIGDLFITQNRTKELMNLGLVETLVRGTAILSTIRFGIVAAALAFSITTVLVVIVRALVAGRKGPVNALDHMRAYAPAIPGGIGAALGTWAAQMFAHSASLDPLMTALTLAAGGVGTAAVLTLSVPAPRKVLTSAVNLAPLLRLNLLRRTGRSAK